MNIDWGVVVATLCGPIFAVWASEWRQQMRSKRERMEWVFRTLMSTRAARLHLEHVSALNQIDFAFPHKDCPTVQDAWCLYRQHLRKPTANTDEAIMREWASKSDDLFVDLLHKMAIYLNISCSKSEIVDNSYYPNAYLAVENSQQQIRELVLQVLKNERSIGVNVNPHNTPNDI